MLFQFGEPLLHLSDQHLKSDDTDVSGPLP
jgi:hypothetical protein